MSYLKLLTEEEKELALKLADAGPEEEEAAQWVYSIVQEAQFRNSFSEVPTPKSVQAHIRKCYSISCIIETYLAIDVLPFNLCPLCHISGQKIETPSKETKNG